MAVRLTIIGSTGGTGQRLTEQALSSGHHVIAVARRPEAVTARHDRLRVVGADVLARSSLTPAVEAADAVISALGIGYRRHATTVYSAGTENVLAAMADAGVRRLVCVSTAGLTLSGDSSLLHRLVLRHVLHRLLRKPYEDMSLMEELVRASAADWTIVRAARLTNGPLTGRYRTRAGANLPGAWSISRADLASYLLSQVEDAVAARETVEIAY
ncbi:MAG TPA: NAD(P)H-binding protein [Streptosporangiaceae bacterium]|jgi:putative NADH-flavin reductase